MLETSYGAQLHISLWWSELYAVGWSLCGLCGPSVVAGLTTVGTLVGRAGPWPNWLPVPTSCGACQPAGGQVHVPMWLLVSLGLSDPRASTEPLVGGVRIKGSWLWGLRGLVLVPTCWKQVSLTLLGKMEVSKTVFASTTVLVVEWAPTNGCHQHLYPQVAPAFLGGSLRSVSWSDSGSFEMTASVLGLRTCDILHMSCKNRVSVSITLWLSHIQTLLAFKARCSGVMSSQCRTLGLGILMWDLNPLFLGENLHNCDYSPLCGSPTWGLWILSILCLSLLPVSLQFLLYILVLGKYFLLDLMSFA